MFDFEIAFYLYKMSRVQEIFLESPYKARAYYSAALAIDSYERYVEEVYKKDLLRSIPYVGSKIESSIIEIVETGELKELKQYEREFGIVDYSLVLSYGLTDTIIKKLVNLSVNEVENLLDEYFLRSIEKEFSTNEFNKILKFVEEIRENQGNYLLAYGECLGRELVDCLKNYKGVKSADICGAIASCDEKIKEIEICFEYKGNWENLVRYLKRNARISNVKNRKFGEITGKTCFGIPFVLTFVESRECKGEIYQNDYKIEVKGDLHSHSVWTDGIHSIEQMVQRAVELGYEYLAITDHSYAMRIAHGLSESQALCQLQEIRELNKKSEIKVLAGIEVDILANGELDFCNEVLSQFDFVIAAIHSHLNQEPLVLYERLKKALSNPYVNILAHPTGRLLGRPGILFSKRAPYNLEIRSIIDLCKDNNVALEINCFPERLDLDEKNAEMAVNEGVKISLGTDAHSLAHLSNIKYGIDILKKGRVNKNMILNTYSYEELMSFFKLQRGAVEKKSTKKNVKRKKDFKYYFGNNAEIINGDKKIIGIDLTGSEDKESGWAYMVGNNVRCRRIKTDAELIDTVQKLNPDVVSIDSPLAYPKGRCCSKKECECSKYGIMRKSERLLRHFGVTVYPCLIDSMVNLTTRGMRLAKILRNMGYTVIESYPGVAQDILMIPRKGKTVEQFFHLKQGLISFGIEGDLIENVAISHDEVDAVTSALVGYFYLNGQYIGLGDDDEDYLIVPRIQEELFNKRIIIGLSGETGAGKTTVAEYLRFKYGLKYFRYSQVIEQKYNVSNKEELQRIGAQIAQDEQEQRALTRYMIKNMDPNSSYVIDGMRHMEDYDEMKDAFGEDFVFIYLECRYLNRYKRYNKLHFNCISEEQFKAINNHKSETDIVMLQLRSDYRINNNNSFKELRESIEEVIKKESGGIF